MNDDQNGLKALEERSLLPTYAKFPFALARGSGAYVWDEAGRRYLDFYGGHAVCLLGHCPPRVVEAVCEQAKRLLFYSNLVYHGGRARAAEALVKLCAVPGGQVFFCNSGAEANEAAMRVARRATGRPRIIATLGSFHGRTAGALAATGLASYKKDVPGLGRDVSHIPFGDLAAAEAALTQDAAGIILEPIQSMAGIVVPPPDYLPGLAELCRRNGSLLIFDEVQTGLGRLGAPTASQAFGVEADILTFAKALGSGVPCAAILAGPRTAATVKPGDLGSTFGGGPLACAAILATLEVLGELRLWENAARLEAAIRRSLRFPRLREIRGRGLLLGLVLDGPSQPTRDALLRRAVLVGGAHDPNVIRLLPPLVIGDTEVALLREALAKIWAAAPAAAANAPS